MDSNKLTLEPLKTGLGIRGIAALGLTVLAGFVAYKFGNVLYEANVLYDTYTFDDAKVDQAMRETVYGLLGIATSGLFFLGGLRETLATYLLSRKTMTINRDKQTITQDSKEIDYDALIKIRTKKGPLEKFLGLGTIEMETLKLQEEGPEINSFEIPYLSNTGKLQQAISEKMPKYTGLRQKVFS